MWFFFIIFYLYKNIMFNMNKCRFYLWLLLFIFAWVLSVWHTNAANFVDRLSDIWMNVGTFSEKNSISRYEISRLLSASNCEDCVHAPEWMKQLYTKDFWNEFKAIDGKYFDDIDFEGGVRNKNSYYYCVAYVWDNGYMGWYPQTSVKCQWKFCGQDSVTTSEFYQMVLNIIQDQIRPKYNINWLEVKSWLKWLKKNSIQRKVLNQTDVDAINNADLEAKTAQNNAEFQAWLKYCMYNLEACDFQKFGVIGVWYWPVSELNILYKEWIITMEDALATASSPYLKWEEAIRVFSSVYDDYSSCSFNTDYDCDGIVNWRDNCPYMYNPNQYDLDGDWQWNVCDQDADWDWKKNPVWIVDDNNHIVVSLWNKDLDETPLWDSDLWYSFFINVDAISTGFPTAVRFVPLTNWDIVKVEWDFWDWTKQVVDNSGKVNHIFQDVGNFTVSAVATSKDGSKAYAMTKIFIANPTSEDYMLNLSASALFKNWNIEYTLTPLYEGNLDTIKWSVNNWEEISQKVTENFKTTIKEDGLYIVNAKWYVKWELRVVAMLSIVKDWTPAYAGMNLRVGDLWNKSAVITELVWVDSNSVRRININWWPSSTYSTNLSQSYVYEDAWIQTIQQNVVLKNWITLNSMATISIHNPLLMQSYAANVQWERLTYNQNEKLSLWLDIYPKSPVLSLFTSYQAGSKNFIYNPDLSKTVLDFSYVTAWDKLLTNSVGVNRCVALTNQWTVHIKQVDTCLSALKSWKLSQYKCDMDNDGTPDICDDDIDGDGIKNLIWIVVRENKDCSINSSNINGDLFKQQFWVCSLDNCPFDSNSNQTDLDNDWVGDICRDWMFDLMWSSGNGMLDGDGSFLEDDIDKDGIIDSLDACVDVPWNSPDWCPDYYTRNCWARSKCGNNEVDPWETCLSCPQDVWSCCGNGVFDYWESCRTCPGDSGECGLCGNGHIDDWETCENCPEDLWACSGICGNGQLDKWEDCWNCPVDAWECTTTCGNKKVDDGEDCMNCPEDLWKCSAVCGNKKIEKAETCENCPEDVPMCKNETCGNGVVDESAWEECDSWKDKDWNAVVCTKMCTKLNLNKPLCGNGDIDDGEDCKTCPVDLWYRCLESWKVKGKCGNGDIDDGENCLNCPEDVWKCTASCGNDIVEDAEDCTNCKKDAGECSASCGNGKIEKAETCENCPQDVPMCKSATCGNGVVDILAWEECDGWKDKNWNVVVCTDVCTIYDANVPMCGNGHIDRWETCKNCPEDLKEKCILPWKKSEKKCGNGEVDKWENCKNCPEDVKECTATCWDEIIQAAEDCRNCSKDVWKCTAFCGNENVEMAEDCTNCSKDVKMCRIDTCGNWKVEETIWEECDSWKDRNWNEVECTKMCIIYDSSKPLCGNGVIDKWETCETCQIDLWEKCVTWGNVVGELCGNGVIDNWEQCDPNDSESSNWWSDGCSNSCKKVDKLAWKCNPVYDWKILKSLLNSSGLCSRWSLVNFSFNAPKMMWTWSCKNAETWNITECMAYKSYCWNGRVDEWEDCDNCSEDLKENCIAGCDAEFAKFPSEECPSGAVCSYTECENTIKYKIDRCQDGYVLENGECTCDKQTKRNVTTDGTYKCSCPYGDLCFMEVWIVENSYPLDASRKSDTYFILDDEWAVAAGIENMDTIRDKRTFLDGAGEVISVLQNYMSPANCEEIGQRYFSEKWKNLSAIYHDTESCTPWCPCADLDDCPSELKKQCEGLCGNGLIDKWETCETCSDDLKNICVDICIEDFKNYPLTDCPDWAICSYTECGGTIKYKIDSCQGDYELKNGTCQCIEDYTNTITTDGTYKCSCPYGDLCFMEVWIAENSYPLDASRKSDDYLILDDKWAAAAGIENMDSIWDKRSSLDGAGEVISVLQNYMSPANCEEIGQKYFSEKWKEISITYHEDKDCNPGCPCEDLNNCPDELKDRCDIEDEDENEDCDCTTCPEKLKERCLTRPSPDNPVPENNDDNGWDDDWGGWNISNGSCNSCPCEYADFSTDLVKWDSIRAKLWDKSLSAFYRYSNSVAIDSLMDSDNGWWSGGWGSWGWGWAWNPSMDDTKQETRKAKLIIRRDGGRTVREFIVPDGAGTSTEKNSGIWTRFKNLIWL